MLAERLGKPGVARIEGFQENPYSWNRKDDTDGEWILMSCELEEDSGICIMVSLRRPWKRHSTGAWYTSSYIGGSFEASENSDPWSEDAERSRRSQSLAPAPQLALGVPKS